MNHKKPRVKDNKRILVVKKINRQFNLQTFDTIYDSLNHDLSLSKVLKQRGFLLYSFTPIMEAIKSQEPKMCQRCQRTICLCREGKVYCEEHPNMTCKGQPCNDFVIMSKFETRLQNCHFLCDLNYVKRSLKPKSAVMEMVLKDEKNGKRFYIFFNNRFQNLK